MIIILYNYYQFMISNLSKIILLPFETLNKLISITIKPPFVRFTLERTSSNFLNY